VITYYIRIPQQAEMLWLQAGEPEKSQENELRNKVYHFNTNCPECNAPAETNMNLVQNLPHFKEVMIMDTNCENCRHQNNEVKSGEAVESLGTRIILYITVPSDMTRDLLKSDTCSVELSELEIELGMTVLKVKLITLEELMKNI
jgi:zinc finger protein